MPDPLEKSQRQIRVFISSTFRDMHAEREELVKQVFTQLRKLCESRGVTWGEVDLRWGIPEEAKAEGKVLPLCLAEIERCRPFFIGILGERYGWVPDEIPAELAAVQPWLKESATRSVTALEILHGVLRDPKMANHAFFYFRDPQYVQAQPASERQAFIEESPEGSRRLAALKDEIRHSGVPVREPYSGPKDLAALVLRDMTEVIDRLYPEQNVPDALERQALDHEAFAVSRARVYIGRRDYFDHLDAHAAGDGPPLVVLGESGGGKSALLANWAIQWRARNQDVPVLLLFTGSTPDSTDWVGMLRQIVGELRKCFNLELEIPDKPDALRAVFANALHMAAARGRFVVVLDALNQLEDRDGALDLVWLPPVIPSNVRLILSTLPGRPLDDLRKRGWPSLTVEPLSMEDRRQLIERYLGQYAKSLSSRRAEHIAAAGQTSNPLYLRSMLEELRVFGAHERLDQRIDYYLDAGNLPTLFERILARWEEDYERDFPGLVGEALSLIWAARRGLSEAELLDLLGNQGTPLPTACWSPLSLAAEAALMNGAGLIGFAHDFIRTAVVRRYAAGAARQQALHIRLADYWTPRSMSRRKVDELPWQLQHGTAWQRLAELLKGERFFGSAWETNEFEVKAYWTQIEANSTLSLVDSFSQVIEKPSETPKHASCVGSLLADTGHPAEALAVYNSMAEYFEKRGDLVNLAKCIGSQALMLRDRGDLDWALAMLKKEEGIYRNTGDDDGLQISLGNQALLLFDRGDLDGAMALHKEKERICRELGSKRGLRAALGNQAVVLQVKGDLEGAAKKSKEAERICREMGDEDGLQASLGNLALNLRARGDLSEALVLLQEQEQICRKLGNKRGLWRSLAGQAEILHTRGDLNGAMRLIEELEQLCRNMGDRNGLQAALSLQATIFKDRGDLDRAMKLHKEQEQICRELEAKGDLANSLGNQALILQDRGDLDGAMALHREEEDLQREIGNQDGLAVSLGNQALILKASGDLDGAMSRHLEEERICREIGSKDGLARSLGNRALIARVTGDRDGAMALHKQQEQIYRELGNQNGLQTSLGNQAVILQLSGDLDGAMALYKEKERICLELGNIMGLARSLANQAVLLKATPKGLSEAGRVADVAFRLASQHGYVVLVRQIQAIRDSIRAEML